MATLDDLQRVLERMNIEDICEEIAEENSVEFIKLQQEQMKEGKLNTGSPITPNYTASYAKKKGFSTPNLYNTGEFYKSMNVLVNRNTFAITSAVPYEQYLEKRYTTDIWGLDEENQQKFITEFIGPSTANKLESLGFKTN